MIANLERMLQGTGHASMLARDMLTPLLYGIEVRIILDNSGSMQLDMLGQGVTYGYGGEWISMESNGSQYQVRQALESALPSSIWSRRQYATDTPTGGESPFHRRWYMARSALQRWMSVFSVLGIDPWVYPLNTVSGRRCRGSEALTRLFSTQPEGSTPMTECLNMVLTDDRPAGAPLLVLALTDGEANDMPSFNATLDRAQNGVFGDVQICLMGLSLVKEDIEWFENEECDETRIRTVEAYEVECRQIMLKEVVKREGGYTYDMHLFRVLVTNFFPADYDYEAPLQNFRHRLYITIHGRDRWWGLNNSCYWLLCSTVWCNSCFLGSCCHCCGWCQGNECGKCQKPELLESLLESCRGEE